MAPVPDEIELKLELPRRDLRRLLRAASLGPYLLERIPPADLQTTYLDTHDRRLAAHGLALRVRRDGTRWEATLKWPGNVRRGLHSRAELNVRLRQGPKFPWRPRAAALQGELAVFLGGVPVAPILITNILRERRLVRRAADGPILAEIDLDDVSIQGPNGPKILSRYCEVEIEQREGTVSELRRLGREIRRITAATPTSETKYSRGMRAVRQ